MFVEEDAGRLHKQRLGWEGPGGYYLAGLGSLGSTHRKRNTSVQGTGCWFNISRHCPNVKHMRVDVRAIEAERPNYLTILPLAVELNVFIAAARQRGDTLDHVLRTVRAS